MKKAEPGWFEGAPIDDHALNRVLEELEAPSKPAVEKLAAALVVVLTYEVRKEIDRRSNLRRD